MSDASGAFVPELFRLDLEFHAQWHKWGDQRHDDFKWITVLTEEVGEAAKDSLEGRDYYLYSELIQVAAVALNHARTVRLRLREAGSESP